MSDLSTRRIRIWNSLSFNRGRFPVCPGERHTGSVEVIGSIPTVSTICDGEMSPRKALMNQGLFAFYGIIFKLHVRRCEVGIFPLRTDVNSNQTEYPYKIGR